MTFKHLFSILFIFQIGLLNAQIAEFSTIYSENKITNFENQKLILIDFWATWCAPCVYASQQLEIFQEDNKEKVFVISETDESEKKIIKFLQRNPCNLMIVTDVQKINIEKYNVSTRPFAVLLDLNGKLLWSGHPSDLSQRKLDEFYNISKKIPSVNFNDLIAITSPQKNSNANIEDFQFELKKEAGEENRFEKTENGIIYNGKLSTLIAKLSNKNIFEINIDNDKNFNINFKCTNADWTDKTDLLNRISKQFNLVFTSIVKDQFVNRLEVDNQKLLWQPTEIIWEDSSEKFLIGESKITANDCSINELALILSDVKKSNFVYTGIDNALYDWDFQFKFDDLMSEDLSSTFGIKIIHEKISQQILKIEFID